MFLDQNDHPRDIVCERYTDLKKKKIFFVKVYATHLLCIHKNSFHEYSRAQYHYSKLCPTVIINVLLIF